VRHSLRSPLIISVPVQNSDGFGIAPPTSLPLQTPLTVLVRLTLEAKPSLSSIFFPTLLFLREETQDQTRSSLFPFNRLCVIEVCVVPRVFLPPFGCLPDNSLKVLIILPASNLTDPSCLFRESSALASPPGVAGGVSNNGLPPLADNSPQKLVRNT